MIEIGEYIRTRGRIGKLKRIELDKNDISLKWYVFDGKDEFGIKKEIYVNKPYIEKHSKNIIDIIEVGDIVEILINEITKDTNKVFIVNNEQIEILKKCNKNYLISIQTKEQYEANCYKLNYSEKPNS